MGFDKIWLLESLKDVTTVGMWSTWLLPCKHFVVGSISLCFNIQKKCLTESDIWFKVKMNPLFYGKD